MTLHDAHLLHNHFHHFAMSPVHARCFLLPPLRRHDTIRYEQRIMTNIVHFSQLREGARFMIHSLSLICYATC